MTISSITPGDTPTPAASSPRTPVAAPPAPTAPTAAPVDSDGDHDGSVGGKVDVKG